MRYNAVLKFRPRWELSHSISIRTHCSVTQRSDVSVGLTGKNDQEVFEKLLAKLDELMRTIEIKPTIKDYGVDEKYFLDTLDEMTEQAFNDQCTGANPRYPLVSEIKEMYLKSYYGE